MDRECLLSYLKSNGIVQSRDVVITPLSGGVSSDIHLVEASEGAKVVVKQARPQLKVRASWTASTSRSQYEQRFIQYVRQFLPDSVPTLIHADPGDNLFVMEYFGEAYLNLKSLLMEGSVPAKWAMKAGQILGTIHRRSARDESIPRDFAAMSNFEQLRLEPYLLYTAHHYPSVAGFLRDESRRLKEEAECLIHGDYSPKNILVSEAAGRMVILDAEVACHGDPAFDVAFFINHLLLKSVFRPTGTSHYLTLAGRFWEAYCERTERIVVNRVERRTTRLIPMLLLARIDGKSPVEYITHEEQKEAVRDFALQMLSEKSDTLTMGDFLGCWKAYRS